MILRALRRWRRNAATVSLLGAGSLALAQATLPPRVAACGGNICRDGSFYLEPGVELPANTPALRWLPPLDHSLEQQPTATLHVARIDGGEEVALELEPADNDEVLVRLPEGLVAGARYRISVESESHCVPPAIEFAAVAAAELPQRLGSAVVGAPRRDQVQVAGSSACYTPLPAVFAEVDVKLAGEAEPWAPLLAFTTRVDGDPWRPSWSLSSAFEPYSFSGAQTLVFAACPGQLASGESIAPEASPVGLAEGRHQLTIEARLPGVERVLKTDGVEVALECGERPADPIASDDEPAPEPPPADEPGLEPGRDQVDAGNAGSATSRDGGRDDRDDSRSGDRTYVETHPNDANGGTCALAAPRDAFSGSSSLGLVCMLAAAGSWLARRRLALSRSPRKPCAPAPRR